MAKITVFIDESGTLPDPKDKIIVVAAVGVYSPRKIDEILKTVRKRGRFKRITGEIKFYTAGEKSKFLFFEKIVEENFDIFVLTVDKIGRKIEDTPENFAVICGLLLQSVFAFYPNVREIIFDRHFHKDKDIEKFNKTLNDFLKRKLPKIDHVYSQRNKEVNVADMVAGAILAKETGEDPRFYKIFKGRIVTEARVNWPEAKRRLFK
ncbi:MAG: DUF3800 domain-containing protein [bacterium]|nr:DUF3800 domain-containing protein [bacterium]